MEEEDGTLCPRAEQLTAPETEQDIFDRGALSNVPLEHVDTTGAQVPPNATEELAYEDNVDPSATV